MSSKKNKGKAKFHISDSDVYFTIDGKVLTAEEELEYFENDKQQQRQKEFEAKFGNQPEKVDTIDARWSIADDMRQRKEAGEFSSYMEAYRWASKHMTSNGKSFTAESLQNEYHKAKSKGVVD